MRSISPIGINTGIGVVPQASLYWSQQNITPVNLTALIVTGTRIDLTTDYSGTEEDGFKWERSSDNGANYIVIGTTNNGVKSFSDITCELNTLYLYRVRAYRGSKYSTYSNIDSANIFVIDKDNNVYDLLTVGSQIWLKQNLKSTKYEDNSDIPTGLSNANWALEDGSAGHDGAFSPPNNNIANKSVYGLLYNYYALANAKGLNPTGSHFPTLTELTALMNKMGGTGVAGGKLKEIGISHWTTPNTGAVDSVGFKALPAGYRNATTGAYDLFNTYNILGTSTAFNATNINRGFMANANDDLALDTGWLKKEGVTLRCLADLTPAQNPIFADTFLGDIIPSMDAYGEPSVLISEDGEQIDLWFTGTIDGISNIYYSYSIDGNTFSVPQKTNIPNGYGRGGVGKENNTYYHFANLVSPGDSIHLFTSTDKINFTDQGEMIGLGAAGQWDAQHLGNTHWWKISDTYYLFYDGINTALNGYWKTGVATATSLSGPWTKSANNPVFKFDDRDTEGAEMFRINNQPIKHGGYYYAYQAYGERSVPGHFEEIIRFRTTDFLTWEADGITGSPYHLEVGYVSYADAAYCQYKGKSYMFMNPSNQINSAYIDIGIDNRPLIALLARPL